MKKVSCAQLMTPPIIYASSTKKGKPMNKCENVKMLPIAKPSSNWHWALALATMATLATFASGCVIGHARFEGEDMHLYPFSLGDPGRSRPA